MATYTLEVPVEPGTPIYVLDPCYCTPFYIKDCRQRNGNHIRMPENRKCIAVFPTENKKGRAHCWKLYCRPFNPVKHLALWGKQAFETEAEARAAIAKKTQKEQSMYV